MYSWSENGILTGGGDNKIRLFRENSEDGTWLCVETIEMTSDINTGLL